MDWPPCLFDIFDQSSEHFNIGNTRDVGDGLDAGSAGSPCAGIGINRDEAVIDNDFLDIFPGEDLAAPLDAKTLHAEDNFAEDQGDAGGIEGYGGRQATRDKLLFQARAQLLDMGQWFVEQVHGVIAGADNI